MKLTILSLLATASLAVAQKCYSVDGQQLDSRYQPCFPQAANSGCCMLNGTQGDNQQNDICLDSGLCQSTSGWYAGFLYINGCTDKTGKDPACSQICNFLGSQYSWSVLQCQPGQFCCRAASDTSNCCGNNRTMISTSHIGNLLLPGSSAVVNTTFNTSTSTSTPVTANNSSSHCATSSSDTTCPADRSVVVGGAVGGVLGAALIASLVALLFTTRSKRQYKSDLQAASAALSTAEMTPAADKAHYHHQYAETTYSHTPSTYTHSNPYEKAMSANIVEMPVSAYGRTELEGPHSSRSELVAGQSKSTHS